MLFCAFLLFLPFIQGEGLIEFFKWKQLAFDLPTEIPFSGNTDFVFPSKTNAGNNRDSSDANYIPYSNVPMGVTHFREKLFITTPRRRPGIPSTLNFVRIDSTTKSPKLIPYPSYYENQLDSRLQPDPDRLISVYRTRVDACNRLWFIDTGMLEYPNNRTQVQRPALWIVNLENNKRIRRFEIDESIVPIGRGIASVTVDLDSKRCDDAYAYIPDLVHNCLLVYSFRQNRIWVFQHNFFSFDPMWGDFNIAGQKFQWNDGIFSITLGNRNPDGYRTAYFHPMCSVSEFSVSTKVLRNETNSQRSNHGNDFINLGMRGSYKQSTIHAFHPETGIIMYAEISKYGVGCWNTNKEFSIQNHGTVDQNERKMIYPSDLTIDDDGVVWVMTNSMPIFIYSTLNENEYNFRVWKQDIRTAVADTVCSPTKQSSTKY